jgi:hypothetical protein
MQAPTGYNEGPPRRRTSPWIWVVVVIVVLCGCGGLGGIAILFPVFLQARTAAIRTQCVVNTKQIAMAQLMYSSDNNDRWAPSAKWLDLTQKYASSERNFTCPAVRRQRLEYGYAMNAALGGKKQAAPADLGKTIVTYETATLSRNAAGDPKAEANPNRHGNGRTESYDDGHAAWIKGAPTSSGSR